MVMKLSTRFYKRTFLILAIFWTFLVSGQVPLKTNHIAFKTQFFQVKDAFNYGLVYSGMSLAGSYMFSEINENRMFKYTPDVSLGICFSKGAGLNIHFKPADFYLGWQFGPAAPGSFVLGPYILTDYNWQTYPDLQSGHMFWFSSLETGVKLLYELRIKSRMFKLGFSNSLAGWTSRPEPSTETYFYSFTFSDFVSNVHSNLKFGSFNRFNHTHISVELLNRKEKRLAVGYGFEYFGYYKQPRLSYLVHSFNMKWKLGKKVTETKSLSE